MNYKTICFLSILIALITAGDAFAHKVIVFAWVEDGMIHTESSFGSKRKAKNCPIRVVDEKGTVVHTGVTDEQGDYVFKIPDHVDSDLIVHLDAGTGHSATWRVPYDELVTPTDEKKLAADMKEKEELEKGPSPLKIIGGIGIIFLLAFLVTFFRKKRQPMIEEKFAFGHSMIHQLSPAVRIVSAIVLSVCAALCEHLYIGGVYLMAAVTLCFMARLKWTDVLLRLKPLFWFLLMIWVVVPLTFDGETLFKYGMLEFTRPGILLCAKITVKSISILLIFTALIATMSIASLGNGLHKIHVPDKMVFLLLMSYRYIAVIQEEYQRLLRAAKFRGFVPGTNLHSYKTFAYLAGMLFVRASLRAQRVHNAMLCRGFHQKFYTLDVYPPNVLNTIFLSSICITGSALVLFERFWM